MYFANLAVRVHSTCHVHGVPPYVVLWLLRADHASYQWADAHT